MALKKGAMVVDIYPQFDLSLVGPDGLHPTAAGYARMAQVFSEAIEAAWDQPASGTTSRLRLSGDLVRQAAQETVPCRRRGPGQVCS